MITLDDSPAEENVSPLDDEVAMVAADDIEVIASTEDLTTPCREASDIARARKRGNISGVGRRRVLF